jgi:hypothetical protein
MVLILYLAREVNIEKLGISVTVKHILAIQSKNIKKT